MQISNIVYRCPADTNIIQHESERDGTTRTLNVVVSPRRLAISGMLPIGTLERSFLELAML